MFLYDKPFVIFAFPCGRVSIINAMQIELKKSDGSARTGRFVTSRGLYRPGIHAVGTQGTVKAMFPTNCARSAPRSSCAILISLSAPGHEIIDQVADFINSSTERPILTDSGGFQVFSLAALRKIREDASIQSNRRIAPFPRARKGDGGAMHAWLRYRMTSTNARLTREYDYAVKSLELTTRWQSNAKNTSSGSRECGSAEGTAQSFRHSPGGMYKRPAQAESRGNSSR